MEREVIQPWYRQFWPWFIIGLLASSVIAGLTTVWISLQTTDSLVVRTDDDIQVVAERRINAEQLATELKLAALIEFNLKTGSISVAMRSGTLDPVPATLDLDVAHPAFADRDQSITLHKALPDANGNPVWAGHFVDVPKGRRYLTLRSGEDWRLSDEWQGETSLTLKPHDDGR